MPCLGAAVSAGWGAAGERAIGILGRSRPYLGNQRPALDHGQDRCHGGSALVVSRSESRLDSQ